MSAGAGPLTVEVGGLRLRNPVLTASGCFNLKADLSRVVDLARLGGIVTKTVTWKPRRGNPPPRVAEVPGGLLNAIGLMNEGVAGFLAREFPAYREAPTALVVSIGGDDADEFARVAAAFDPYPEVDALEVNVSCPNVEKGTAVFAARPEATARVVGACREATGKPLWVKLAPESPDLGAFARAAAAAGAAALTVANTYLALAVDWRRRRPRLGRGGGGLSGPVIRPLTLRRVYEAARAVSLPVVASGGAETADDVMEYLVTGARAVQVGTAYLRDPACLMRIVDDLERLTGEIGPLTGWIGTLKGADLRCG